MSESQFPKVTKNDPGIHPTGLPGQCSYCRRAIGDYHRDTCVMVTKKIELEFSFKIPVVVPHFWNQEDIVRHYTQSTWCADNALDMIIDWQGTPGNNCLCPITDCKFVRVLDETPTLRDDETESVHGKVEV